MMLLGAEFFGPALFCKRGNSGGTPLQPALIRPAGSGRAKLQGPSSYTHHPGALV